MTQQHSANELHHKLVIHLKKVYPTEQVEVLAQSLINTMQLDAGYQEPVPHQNNWNEQDIAVITYADTLLDADKKPLTVLHQFAKDYLAEVSILHILPFFPYSSDDGFSVIDYLAVNESHGDWADIKAISGDFKLMSDLVLNHMSARSWWFDNYKNGFAPGKGYFYEAEQDLDTSKVVRPRTTPLLNEVETVDGKRYVWCTFSPDQVDLNFANPEVLIEFATIILQYLQHGVKVFRLDAVAFLWKTPGTSCIHLQETHEIIKVLRVLIEHHSPDAIVITETNVPNRENLTYFGNGNEAHMIYNFSLPPLLIYTLITGNCRHLKSWIMSMPPAQNGTTYFNFIASHDGVGLRPLDGLLSDEEKHHMVETMQQFGAKVSYRRTEEGEDKPYEINISLFDALKGNVDGADTHQMQRFICAHSIMLALEGVPAFYIHSLFGTENDVERVENTGNNRAINRAKWDINTLLNALDDKASHHHQVFNALKNRIAIRKQQKAFHPNATQFTLHFGTEIFGFWRQSIDRQQSIFCIFNISNKIQIIPLIDINLIGTDQWIDLITGNKIEDLQQQITLKPYESLWLSNVK
ncbi:MAG: sugar phosphorylase [Methylophilaceae bacterium]|nr:sugar phosphorylase [Methylophilaceae bacterium]